LAWPLGPKLKTQKGLYLLNKSSSTCYQRYIE
jgi:hypothetical protein